MRLIASLLVGTLLFFFIGHFLHTLRKNRYLEKVLPDINSFVGILMIISGFVYGFINKQNPTETLLALFIIGSGIGLSLHNLLFKGYVLSEKRETLFVKKHEDVIERALEIMPGAITWTILTCPLWLSFTFPFALAYLIILADIYWFISAIRIGVLVIVGYKKMEAAKKVDWLKRLEQDFPDDWKNYYHLLVLPTYNESLEILNPSFQAVADSDYPKDKIFLAVGFEQRMQEKDPEGIAEKIKVAESYSNKIGVFTTTHPVGLPGEIPGPGTNRNWMINNALKEFAKRGIKPEQVFVTTLDADYAIHEKLLAGALHKYLSTPDRDKKSYTGVFLFFNNYWQAPTPMRLTAIGSSLWQLAEMVGSDKYMNYSSLSINMKSLIDVGMWMPDKVNDDSGFYWKAYYHFKGDYKVVPHFLPINGDAVLDVTLWKTFQNQYMQFKRWAYGVEHIPFIVKEYFKNKDINFWDKTDKLFFKIWAEAKWGSLALFVTFAGLFIPYLNPNYSQSVVAYNLPVVSSWVLTGAFLGLFSTIYVHEKIVPPRPKSWGLLKRVWSYLQWVMLPIIVVTISTVPAIDAQTSLMLGRYLEYRTTNKARIKV